MKIVLIEDEIRIAKYLKRLLLTLLNEYHPKICIANTLEEGKILLKRITPNLLFLDLNLNGQDGFQTLEEITAGSFQTIIVSAYKEKAIKAFEYGVLDFIPKPVTKERLNQALNRYLDPSLENTSNLVVKCLSIRKPSGYELIKVENISHISGSGQYSEIHLIKGGKRLHEKTLNQLEILLFGQFIRVHRSYLARNNLINRIYRSESSGYKVHLENGYELPVGRTRLKDVRSLFKTK